MDQARARFRRAFQSGEKAIETLQKAQEIFEQAQQEVVQATPVPQVNASLVETSEALTGIFENVLNSDSGQPPDHLIQAI